MARKRAASAKDGTARALWCLKGSGDSGTYGRVEIALTAEAQTNHLWSVDIQFGVDVVGYCKTAGNICCLRVLPCTTVLAVRGSIISVVPASCLARVVSQQAVESMCVIDCERSYLVFAYHPQLLEPRP